MAKSIQTEVSLNRNTEVFSEENFKLLEQIMYESKFAAGTHLYWEGDSSDKFYFVKSGSVKITKSNDEGKLFILYMHHDGDLFGQIDGLQGSTHSNNAEVLEDSVIGVIQSKDLEILMWQHGNLAVEFMKWMGLMHRLTQTKLRDLMMFGKPGALCSMLIRLSNTYGAPHGKNILITKKLTNNDMADMIGATRESVNRMLSDLKKDDIIGQENGYLVLKNMDALREICQCENCPTNICRI
ncbi:Crp/Fnr family transcriptional regulator [Gorillibacterium massiliense]|uniref:Crp/Fnr family transcriptional regulator n=1 Tax=Gorillibacterium massiliense TaxID=1280390 RepID=UPI0004AE6F8D|nr:Crp/Fnr family transcriptional regulator [Gorillibacterium massiliense]